MTIPHVKALVFDVFGTVVDCLATDFVDLAQQLGA